MRHNIFQTVRRSLVAMDSEAEVDYCIIYLFVFDLPYNAYIQASWILSMHPPLWRDRGKVGVDMLVAEEEVKLVVDMAK